MSVSLVVVLDRSLSRVAAFASRPAHCQPPAGAQHPPRPLPRPAARPASLEGSQNRGIWACLRPRAAGAVAGNRRGGGRWCSLAGRRRCCPVPGRALSRLALRVQRVTTARRSQLSQLLREYIPSLRRLTRRQGMSTKLGSAKRARRLARLFERWQRAFDAGDEATARAARRAIDAAAADDALLGRGVEAVTGRDLLDEQ
jgi:hypothetical protein